MNKKTDRILDMFASVFAFGKANADKFPAGSFGGTAFAAIGTGIEQMSTQLTQVNLALGQARASTLGRAAAREALILQMEAISRAAQGIAIDVVGTDRKFKMTECPRRDKATIAIALTFAQAALPLKENFVEHQLPTDFLDSLNAAVQSFQGEIANRSANKTASATAALEFERLMDAALTNLQRLDSIVPNVLRDDSTLGAWKVARRVTRGHPKAADTKKPDNTGTAKPSVPVTPLAGKEAAPAP